MPENFWRTGAQNAEANLSTLLRPAAFGRVWSGEIGHQRRAAHAWIHHDKVVSVHRAGAGRKFPVIQGGKEG
jgi:hypothetical protein